MSGPGPGGRELPVLLECTNIRKKYGSKEVLSGATLTVCQGQLAGLTGENGSGKSTLLRCMLNLDRFYRGRVRITRSTGYCPQDNYLRQQYTLSEHIGFIKTLNTPGTKGDSRKDEPPGLAELLELFRLTPYWNTLIGRLSSGTYQKLKFITALINHPRLLILDEPYDGFDWNMYLVFWEIITRLQARGCGILLVSHFIHDWQRFDLIYKLEGGAIGHPG